jgi:mono/diheme cytochrome c family protein
MFLALSHRLWRYVLPFVFLYAPAAVAEQVNESTMPSTPLEIGRAASTAELEKWNLDVMPDGTGLPPGGGTAVDGEPIYADQCADCHGGTGQKGRDWLVGRQPGDAFPFGQDPGKRKTIGSYWPYATTLFDYIRRAMPSDAPGGLSDDQIYALTAHLLHLNGIIDADTEMNAQSLPQVRMPARDYFVSDDRLDGVEIR